MIYIGSSRHDERGKYHGGKAGDQQQTSSTWDTRGEVSIQTLAEFVGSRAWYILRPKNPTHAKALAQAMLRACNNPNIGYNQDARYGVVKMGTATKTPTNSDCSSLVRQCIKEATGKDVGDFTTGAEPSVLERSGLFEKAKIYTAGMTIYEGDVFVTQSKGHTGACVVGQSRTKENTSVTNGKYIYKNVDYGCVFDPAFYANAYSDLRAAFGTDATMLFKHFCQYGMKEQRQACDSFNVKIYMAKYPDLQKAYGSDAPSYYMHYALFGKKEGRIAI